MKLCHIVPVRYIYINIFKSHLNNDLYINNRYKRENLFLDISVNLSASETKIFIVFVLVVELINFNKEIFRLFSISFHCASRQQAIPKNLVKFRAREKFNNP